MYILKRVSKCLLLIEGVILAILSGYGLIGALLYIFLGLGNHNLGTVILGLSMCFAIKSGWKVFGWVFYDGILKNTAIRKVWFAGCICGLLLPVFAYFVGRHGWEGDDNGKFGLGFLIFIIPFIPSLIHLVLDAYLQYYIRSKIRLI